jgi:4-amino-4-deoxy-L-arabinose transferase-like glycosyltransferase
MRPNARKSQAALHITALFLLWLAVYASGIFRPSLLDDADSVHAEAAREILLRHDWVTLHVNGIRYLEKAPLLYWMMAGSFRLFGVHDWSARLPLILGVLALLCAVYFVGKQVYGEAAGFYGALASGFAFGPYIFTRFLIPDVLVGLWLVLTLAFFFFAFESEQPARWACWGFAASCALNVLTKGLIGLVFPFAAVGIFVVLTGQWQRLLRMRVVSSIAVFLAIAAPWHVLAGLRNPTQGNVRGFFWFYFVNEHFLRYLNKRVPRDYDTVPLLLFWGLLLVWLFPWSSFLPQALARVPIFSRKRLAKTEAQSDRGDRASVLFLLGAVMVVLFFSFSTRQEYYVLPALPLFALLIGRWLGEEETADVAAADGVAAGKSRAATVKRGTRSAPVLAFVGVAAFAVTVFLALTSGRAVPNSDIVELLRSGPAESQQYALSLGHMLDLNRRVMPLFRGPLVVFGVSLLAGTGLNWYFRKRGRAQWGNWALTGMSVGLLVAVHTALVTFSPILTSKPLADAIAKVYQPGDIIEINGEYEGGSTLNYYTGRQVRILNGRSANLWYGSFFPDAPQIFDDNGSFAKLWNGPQRVFLWTESEKEPGVLAAPGQKNVFVLARSGGKVILTNRRLSS